MQQLELRKLQMLELEIAKEIKRVCEENKIDYFIDGGTLLGAVRHKGFIPWDDDMDIGMTADNYDRFLRIAASKLDDRFFLQSSETDNSCAYVFSKVRLNSTHIHEKVTDGRIKNDGIFVDIFPFDEITQKMASSKYYMNKLHILGKMKMLRGGYDLNSITNNKFSKIANVLLAKFPIKKEILGRLIDKEINVKTSDETKDYYVERDGMFKGKFVFPKVWFNRYIDLLFEDTYFKAPIEYDLILKHAYGDYMQLPPEEERLKGHSVLGIELDYDYESYFKPPKTV